MEVNVFRSKIKPNAKLLVEGKEFSVKEVIKFRFDDGTYYVKCFLSGGYVFADDEESNSYILVKPIETPFEEPFPESLEFMGKRLDFLFTARATAEETFGEEIFKKGESEKFWDFKAADGSYLSLGINDQTAERADDFGKIIAPDQVALR